VAHRDVHPKNILINDMGEAELCDFGLSTAIEDATAGSGLTSGGPVGVNVAYTAPEVLLVDEDSEDDAMSPSPPAVRNAAADMYSFGCVMLEVLSGIPPFHHMSIATSVMMKVRGRPLKRQTYDLHYPEPLATELWNLVSRCLESDPIKRPKAEDVQTRLGELRGLL